MEHFLTQYIYPLEREFVLSKKLDIKLDNPRTEKEIEIIRKYLSVSLNSPDEAYQYNPRLRIPIEAPPEIVSIQGGLQNFKNTYQNINQYISDFFQNQSREDCFAMLAKMWVIARYGVNSEFYKSTESPQTSNAIKQNPLFFGDEDDPCMVNFLSYANLLSLLTTSDKSDYYGESFILHSYPSKLYSPEIDIRVNKAVLLFSALSDSTFSPNEDEKWLFFPTIMERFREKAHLLESAIDNMSIEKILYIGNLLRVIGKNQVDDKLKFVTLISIIELLLTHSPNFQRFNVEDSISKQFRLKASILLYQHNKSMDLNLIKKRLKVIYEQRSNIAHGNFQQLHKYLKGLSKKENNEEHFFDLVEEVYSYTRIIIEEYLKDKNFVEFLKEN